MKKLCSLMLTNGKILLLFFVILFSSKNSFSQVYYLQDWDVGDLNSWTTTNSGFARTTITPCVVASVRANINSSIQKMLISPLLGTSNGDQVTLNFKYKIINVSGGGATANNFGNLKMEYASNIAGPWTTIQTISNDHIPSVNCISKSVQFTPPSGNLYIRFNPTWAVGNYYMYFDDVSVLQGNCFPPTNLTVLTTTNNAAILNWTAPIPAPSGGYNWEVRTSGAPGSGPTGLVSSGNEPSTTSTVTGLTGQTTYTYYLRSYCGGANTSGWVSTPFTTLCDTISTYPFTEGFNTPGNLSSCWSVYEGNINATQHWEPVANDVTHGAASPAEGAGFMRMNYFNAFAFYNPYYLQSNSFNLGSQKKVAKFALWMGANSGLNNLRFEISNDGGGTWVTLAGYTADPSNNNASAPWDNKVISLASYVNQTVMFRLRASSGNGLNGYCNIGFDNFVIENAPPCAEPTSLSANTITTSSAKINFSATPGSFILEYGLSGFSPGSDNTAGVGGSIILGSSSPITITGLTSNTLYDVYIRRDCGSGIYSINSIKTSFTTLCTVVSTYPFYEGFNSATLPTCWQASEGNAGANQHWQPVTTDVTHGAASSSEGSHFLRMNYYLAQPFYNPYYLKSKSFNLGSVPRRAKFALWMGSSSGNNNLIFEISNNGGVTWTTLATYSANPANNGPNTPWENKSVNLSSYLNQTVIFRLNATSNYGENYCNIGFDNFIIEDLPSCVEPTSLSISSITTTSASVAFASSGSSFIVEYGVAGFTPGSNNNPGVGGTIVTGTSSPIAISSLTPSITYDVYVRQDCGGVFSGNSIKASFTTLCNPVTTFPYNEGFESGSMPVCWSKQYVQNTVDWTFVATNNNNSITPRTGTKMANFFSNSKNMVTKLITPKLNLTSLTMPTLRFFYANVAWAGDVDQLRIYYKTSDVGSWVLIPGAVYTTQHTSWTEVKLVLPAPSANYYIAFEGNAQWGRGVEVDDVSIGEYASSNTDYFRTKSSGNWNEANIWQTSVDNVEWFDATLAPDYYASGVYITNNKTVTITAPVIIDKTFVAANGKLIVNNALSIINNGLTLQSSAEGTASIGESSGVITGNLVVERFIPAKATRKWSFLSSPVTQSLSNSWQQQIHITGAGTGGTICPSLTQHSNGYDATLTNSPSIYTYNAAAAPGARWTTLNGTTSNSLGAGKGFRVNVRGPRSIGCNLLNGVINSTSAVTLRSIGSVNNASKNSGGFNLIYPNNGVNNYFFFGNPYPSAISFSALQALNAFSISSSYAVYVPSNASGVYSYWSDDDGFFTGGSGYDDNKGNIIASGQAVFLQSTVPGSVTLEIDETIKDSESTAGYFKANNTKDRVRISLNKDSQIDEVV
ncbi:MAG TPA: choice-of-anchor J domain-containing protein, partial [Chitinophagaceae bacterium]|nr:choice-of-anchor J domain-containing protein [Chitinophagaceae bacterium]